LDLGVGVALALLQEADVLALELSRLEDQDPKRTLGRGFGTVGKNLITSGVSLSN
jgi:hypothetical protein